MNKFKNTKGELHPNKNQLNGNECACQAVDHVQQGVLRTCSTDCQRPRLVIRGERYVLNQPNSGESHHLQAIGSNGKAKIISTTLSKEDAEPLAALTDYLNTTFQFSPTQEKIIELVGYLKLFLGEAFASLEERKGGVTWL